MTALEGSWLCSNTEIWGISLHVLPETKAGAHNPFLPHRIGLASWWFYSPSSLLWLQEWSCQITLNHRLDRQVPSEDHLGSKLSPVSVGFFCLDSWSHLLLTRHTPVYSLLNSSAAKTHHGQLTGPRDVAMWTADPGFACSGTAEGQEAMCKQRADLARQHVELSVLPVKGDFCLSVSWLRFYSEDQLKSSMTENREAFWLTKPSRHD